MADHENKSYGTKHFGANPTYQRLKEELFSNEPNWNALKAKPNYSKIPISWAYQGKLEEFNRINVELNQLEQQIEVDRQNYRLYLSKFEESRISNAMDYRKDRQCQSDRARPPTA